MLKCFFKEGNQPFHHYDKWTEGTRSLVHCWKLNIFRPNNDSALGADKKVNCLFFEKKKKTGSFSFSFRSAENLMGKP